MKKKRKIAGGELGVDVNSEVTSGRIFTILQLFEKVKKKEKMSWSSPRSWRPLRLKFCTLAYQPSKLLFIMPCWTEPCVKIRFDHSLVPKMEWEKPPHSLILENDVFVDTLMIMFKEI